MYAVIKTGGKQYRVIAGQKMKIEQITADIGQQVTITEVVVTVLSQGRHDKVRIFKLRRRKHYQKNQGHRQNYTEIQIASINA